MMYWARSVPCSLINASRDSTHSAVSSGSESGSWLVNPLRIWEVSSPAATSNLSLRACIGALTPGRVTVRDDCDVCDVSVTTARSCAPGRVLSRLCLHSVPGGRPAAIVVTSHSSSDFSAMRSRVHGTAVVFHRHTGCVTKGAAMQAGCPGCDAEYGGSGGRQL